MTEPMSPPPWWKKYTLATQTEAYWQIGPLHLWAQHLKSEWKIAYEREEDPLINLSRHESEKELSDWQDKKNIVRLGLQKESTGLLLKPQLADRPVVIHAEHPITLLPGYKLTIYMSTPLWLEIKFLPQEETMMELPIYRPSDTWFGPNTRLGEICYASRTFCRLNLEELPLRPHRAVTALHLHNRRDKKLLVEKISLPTPYLSLFVSQAGQLWTESLEVQQEKEENAPVKILSGPPKGINIAQKLTEARKKKQKNLALQMLGGILPW